MTAAQRIKSLAYLDERIAARERRVAQLRHDAVAMRDDTMNDWAALVGSELETLIAMRDLIEHYKPLPEAKA